MEFFFSYKSEYSLNSMSKLENADVHLVDVKSISSFEWICTNPLKIHNYTNIIYVENIFIYVFSSFVYIYIRRKCSATWKSFLNIKN